jgi:PEP-CTERM motif
MAFRNTMKVKLQLFPIASAFMMAAATLQAQSPVYSLNAVGYTTTAFQPGANWFGNTLDAGDNTLNALMPTAPTGTTVSLWNSTLNQFTPTATFLGTGWSSDPTINPGTGALLQTTTQFNNVFVGTVLDLDGTPWNINDNFSEPPPFTGPAGLYLLNSKTPVLLSGTVFDPSQNEYPVFESIIGRAPLNGEQVTTLDPLTQTYVTTTYDDGAWNNGVPSLAVGQAAMFNLEAVPEPSIWALLAVGLGTLGFVRIRRSLTASS